MHPIDAQRNPLALPEIRHIIGRFSENNDLISLILVSHAFYHDFVPFLWSNLVFDSHLQQALTKEAFQEHKHLIRNLTLKEHGTFLEYWRDSPCTSLRSLDILPDSYVPRRMTLEEFNQSIADLEGQDSDTNLDLSTSRPEIRVVEKRKPRHCNARVFNIIDLIQQQRNLSILRLNWGAILPAYSIEFSERFYGLPNQLVALHLSKWTVQLQNLNMLLENSVCLREFSARGLFVEPASNEHSAPIPEASLDPTIPPSETLTPPSFGQQLDDQYSHRHPTLNFQRIRQLQLYHFILRISPLSIECPEVESIQLSGYGNTFEKSRDFMLRKGHTWSCPKLKKMEYTGQVDGTEALVEYSERGPISTILNTSADPSPSKLNPAGVPAQNSLQSTTSIINQTLHQQHHGLRRIALTCCYELGKYGSGLWARAQSLHGTTLEAIDLSYSTGLSSLDIYSILTSCTRLRRFQGPEDYLQGQDLLYSSLGPWKCLNLERLQTRFQLTPSNGGHENENERVSHHRSPYPCLTETQQRQVEAMYDQLSGLKRLKVLDLSGYGSADNCTRGIPLTLERGLGKLAGLTEMETVHVIEWEAEMMQPEAEWIARHWPKLKNIYMLHNKNDGEWKRFQECLREAQQRVRDDKINST